MLFTLLLVFTCCFAASFAGAAFNMYIMINNPDNLDKYMKRHVIISGFSGVTLIGSILCALLYVLS